MINDLPTVFEVVTGRMPLKDKPSVESGSKSRNSTKVNDTADGPPSMGMKKAIQTVRLELFIILHSFTCLAFCL